MQSHWLDTWVCAQYEYLWADGVRVKTPVKLSAPDYINALFDWVEAQVRMLYTLCSAVQALT